MQQRFADEHRDNGDPGHVAEQPQSNTQLLAGGERLQDRQVRRHRRHGAVQADQGQEQQRSLVN